MAKETYRKPSDVNTDDGTYGRVAEELFKKIVVPKKAKIGWTLFDVTGEKQYQNISVDYVFSKNGREFLPNIDEVLSNRSEYVLIECKCDTWSWRTRNLYWEHKNKGKEGWSEKMMCDYLFYAHPQKDEENGTYEERTNKMIENTKEVLLVDANKFREYKNNLISDINILQDRKEIISDDGKWYRRRDTYDQGFQHIEKFLIIDIDFKIDDLKKDGVIVWCKYA